MAIRTCENCERSIGHLEPELSWQGKEVCAECYRRLVASLQPAAMPVAAVTAFRRPKKPGVFWVAVGLFAVAMVPMGIEFMKKVQDELATYQTGNIDDLLKTQQGASGSGLAMSLFALAVGVGNMVGFVAAWRGHGWGAWVALGTAVVIVVMELGGQSLMGLSPTPLYILALSLMLAGFGCMVLPAAWAYYRQCAAWRQAQR